MKNAAVAKALNKDSVCTRNKKKIVNKGETTAEVFTNAIQVTREEQKTETFLILNSILLINDLNGSHVL